MLLRRRASLQAILLQPAPASPEHASRPQTFREYYTQIGAQSFSIWLIVQAKQTRLGVCKGVSGS